MKRLDFYALSRNVQDRLVAAFRGEFEPKPLLSRRAKRSTDLVWLAMAAAALVLLAAFCGLGYGALGSRLARHSLPLVGLYVVLAALVALGLLQATAYRVIRRGLPYARGIYLFPGNLIDARDRKLWVYPLETATEITGPEPRAVELRFGTRGFRFAVDPAAREQTVERISKAAERMKGELSDDERQFLDPLQPPKVVSPLASDVPFAPRRALWLRARWVIVAAVGLLGVALHQARDRGSDARMLAFAKGHDDVETYQRYLAQGTVGHAQVARVLLPRAALRGAVAQGTVEAIQQFSRTYPDTDIGPEVATALRAALEAALAEAKRKGTLGALVAFADRYPQHGLADPLKQAQHAIYARALERHRAALPKDNPLLASFLEKLLAMAERLGVSKTPTGIKGPTVEVRVRRMPSRGFDAADKQVRRNPWYNGEASLPSRYVDAAHVEPHETKAAAAFAETFAQQFDPEILTFVAGAPIVEAGDKLPAVTVPTLVLSYRLEPSGATHASKKPRCVVLGLVMAFKSSFILPAEDKPLRLDHTVTAGIPVKLINEQGEGSGRGALETAAYDAMLGNLFADARKRYFASWFRPAK